MSVVKRGMKRLHSIAARTDDSGLEEVTVWDVDSQDAERVARFGGKIDTGFFRLMRLVATFDAIWVPFLVSFGRLHSINVAVRDVKMIICDVVLNTAYACGVLSQLRTSYVVLATGEEHVRPFHIVIYRLTSLTFWLDLVSCVGALWWHHNWHILSLVRMLRLWRLSPSADDLYELHHAQLSSDSASTNLLILLFFTSLVMHLFACSWFFTATLIADWQDLLPPTLHSDTLDLNAVLALYARHMMDGATMLAGWGGPLANAEDGKYTTTEMVSWCVMAPVAALVNGLVFVELIEITHQVGKSTEKHLQRLGELGDVLDSLHAPRSLKNRCMKYHCFLSIHNANRKEYESMFDALSQRLQDEIKVHLFDALVRNAPFFDEIPFDLIHHLVISCQEEVYGPGQTIMRQGEVGSDLFFVMKGSANVFVNELCVATKEVGDYFGEVGLVYDAPRTASVCAKSFTIVARLTRDAFAKVLHEGVDEVREEVTKRIMQNVTVQPDNEKETTPLLSAERDGAGAPANIQRKKDRKPTLGEAIARKSAADSVDSRMSRLEERMDVLTSTVEEGFKKIQSQMLQIVHV